MAVPLSKKLTATTTEKTERLGVETDLVHIKNTGGNNVQIDFDSIVDTDSYLLEIGETLTFQFRFIELHYKSVSGTSTLYVFAIQQ